MLKELRYLLFVFIIVTVTFLALRFYFSETNKKNSYRSLKESSEITTKYSENLILLPNDTNNSIEFVKKNKDVNKKNFKFWELILND